MPSNSIMTPSVSIRVIQKENYGYLEHFTVFFSHCAFHLADITDLGANWENNVEIYEYQNRVSLEKQMNTRLGLANFHLIPTTKHWIIHKILVIPT